MLAQSSIDNGGDTALLPALVFSAIPLARSQFTSQFSILTIAYSNKAFTKLTGYDQADVIGKSPSLLQGEGTDKKVLARLKESMRKGLGDYEGSAINYRKNGTPFIMHWRVVPVKVGGKIKAWVAIQREGFQIPSEDLKSPPSVRFNLNSS